MYAVGLYAEGAETCAASGDAFKGLVESKARKTIVIKMARGIEPKKLVDALEEAFQPRLALPGRSGKNMDLFKSAVTEAAAGSCDTGDEFIFECSGGDTIRFEARKAKGGVNAVKKPIQDADIAFALFDTYLGSSIAEVSPALKESIKKTLSA